MDYARAAAYLESLTDYEKSPAVAYNAANYDLRRMEALLAALGSPHKGRKTVHIAGTKGKGSTAVMTAAILRASGYRTGLFTSPHLYSWQERIAIDGKAVTRRDFVHLAATVRPAVDEINREGRFGKLTTFEAVTAMAFLLFRERRADCQVLETGMGGRLDATNVVEPNISIITSISLDHTQVLGATVEQIAAEKAGIIKPGCTAISAPQSPGVLSVIEHKCRETGAILLRAGVDFMWSPLSHGAAGQKFIVDGLLGSYVLRLPLLGGFQMENAALAVTAAESLSRRGCRIGASDIITGISEVRWPARMQVLQRSPLVIIDGAHNAYSMNTLIASLRGYFTFARAVVIFGCSRDKDIAGMAAELKGFADHVILATSSHARAAGTDELARIFSACGLEAVTGGSTAEAVALAKGMAGKEDLILATGSLFVAAEAGRTFQDSGKTV